MSLNYSWAAGASSVEALGLYGWFQFSVARGVAGVRVGLVEKDTGVDPYEAGFVLAFDGSHVVLSDYGVERRLGSYLISDKWSIVRWGALLLVCRAAPGVHTHPAVPVPLPGRIVYETTAAQLSAKQFLDAAVLGAGDRIVDSSLVNIPQNNGAYCRMRPMALRAFEADYSGFYGSFKPLRLGQVGNKDNGASLSFEPGQLRAFEAAAYSGVGAAFPAMRIRANGQGNIVNGADIAFKPARADITGPGSLALLKARPLAVQAVQAEGYSSVAIKFKPAELFAYSESVIPTEPFGVRMRLEIPFPTLGVEMVFEADEPPVVDDVIVMDGAFAFGEFTPSSPLDDSDITDTAIASDFMVASRYVLVDEVVQAQVDLLAGGVVFSELGDTAFASDQFYVATSIDVADAATASDAIQVQVAITLSDAAIALADAAPQSVGGLVLDVDVLALDSAHPYSFFDLTDGAGAFDGVEVSHDLLVDVQAVAADEYALGSMRASDVTDGALAGAVVDMFGLSSIDVIDGASASAESVTKNRGLVAWTMNTDTGAVAWWDNWAFTDMAVVGGRIFACGPDGLVEVQGGKDGVETIDAKLEYGFSELGGFTDAGLPQSSEQRKRIQSLMFGYHANGLLSATVETYGQGNGAYRYRMEPRMAHQPTNNRVMVGKGLSARYWRIGVENRCGCDFEVHSISAEVAKSQRRL